MNGENPYSLEVILKNRVIGSRFPGYISSMLGVFIDVCWKHLCSQYRCDDRIEYAFRNIIGLPPGFPEKCMAMREGSATIMFLQSLNSSHINALLHIVSQSTPIFVIRFNRYLIFNPGDCFMPII